jgi:hypothetical protein
MNIYYVPGAVLIQLFNHSSINMEDLLCARIYINYVANLYHNPVMWVF